MSLIWYAIFYYYYYSMATPAAIITPGMRFWLASILYEIDKKNWRRWFHCSCLNCWNEFDKILDDLRKENRPRTCGQCNYRKDAVVAIPNEKYFWFTFIKEIEKQKLNRRALVITPEWNEQEVHLHSLINGTIRELIDTRIIHGMYKTNFYKVYRSMIDRCSYEWSKSYHYYGWRWIQCLWLSFDEFKNDMYESYLEHKLTHESTSIERRDVNWNYCKINCEWITMSEQQYNKRKK